MTGAPAVRRGCVVGLGLLGSSVALALRRALPEITLTGVDRGDVPGRAVGAGIVEAAGAEPAAQLEGAGLVVLALPVRAIAAFLDEHGTAFAPGALVTDVGSTKRAVCSAAAALPGGVAFIGGHPMAGRARGGMDAASADLFQAAPWILAPVGESGWDRLGEMELLVARLGARPVLMDPAVHDRAVARLSHLPQIVAMALMELGAAEDLAAAGPAFREMTRLAGSPADIWADIVATNADEIRAAANDLGAIEARLVDRLLGGDVAGAFARSNRLHERWIGDRVPGAEGGTEE